MPVLGIQSQCRRWWSSSRGFAALVLVAAIGLWFDQPKLASSQTTGLEAPHRANVQDNDENRVDALRRAISEDAHEQVESLYLDLVRVGEMTDALHAELAGLLAAKPPIAHSAPWQAARDLLPVTFRESQTARFVVLSDADPAWTLAQAQRLERTHHQVQRVARRLGIPMLPVRHKLVCVLFRNQSDYQAFAQTNDEVTDPGIAGYYSPQNQRLVFYDVESSTGVKQAMTELAGMEEEVHALARRADEASTAGRIQEASVLKRNLASYRRHVEGEKVRVEQFAEGVSAATTVHEAAHQLLFHGLIQSRRVQYPLWISEGLATCFETDDTRGAFGPDHPFAPRRAAFAALLNEHRVMDLAEFVKLSAMPARDQDSMEVVYRQSHALVTWMFRFRREELREYLLAMRREPPGSPTPARHLAIFEKAFGKADALQRAWLHHERRTSKRD